MKSYRNQLYFKQIANGVNIDLKNIFGSVYVDYQYNLIADMYININNYY